MKKDETEHPKTELVTVYSLNDPIEAELIKNTLIDRGIKCELDGERQAGFTGVLDIGVVVCRPDAERAHEIIKAHYSHHDNNQDTPTAD